MGQLRHYGGLRSNALDTTGGSLLLKQDRVIAIIPARGGSKGVPRKNIRSVCGRPLIEWTIEQAKAVDLIDRVIVSTEDPEIAAVAERAGAEIHRRLPEHATDDSLVIDSVKHLMAELASNGDDADVFTLLEPSSPLRALSELRDCIELVVNEDFDTSATFSLAKLNPHRAWTIDTQGARQFLPASVTGVRRQNLPNAYQLNGNVYCLRKSRMPADAASVLYGSIGHVMTPKERGFEIDDPVDLVIVETLLQKLISDSEFK